MKSINLKQIVCVYVTNYIHGKLSGKINVGINYSYNVFLL